MKQNYLIKTFMLLVALVGGVSFSWAEAGNVTDLPTTGSVTLNKADATTSGTIDNTKVTTGEYGSIKEGGTLLFKLSNATAQKYTISFQAGTTNEGSSADIQILSNDQSTVEYSTTVNILTTGAFGNWFTYYFTTSENVAVTESETYKYLKIIFHQSNNDTWVCNAQNITIAAGETASYTTNVTIPAAENAAVTITPGTTTSTLFTGSTKNVTINGVENTPSFDSFSGNGRAIYTIQNNTEQRYKISFYAATNNDAGTLTYAIYNTSYEQVFTSSAIAIAKNGWSTFNPYEYNMSANLPTGQYFFVMKFSNVNVGPVTLTPITSTLYDLTTSVSPVGAGTVIPGSGQYEEGTNITCTQSNKWGYSFTGWTVNGSAAGSESSYTISSIAANTSVVANYEVNDGIFQNIPTAAESYLDLTLYNPDMATDGEYKDGRLDNYRGGEKTQFALRSTIAQKYNVSFKTARKETGTTPLSISFATKSRS